MPRLNLYILHLARLVASLCVKKITTMYRKMTGNWATYSATGHLKQYRILEHMRATCQAENPAFLPEKLQIPVNQSLTAEKKLPPPCHFIHSRLLPARAPPTFLIQYVNYTISPAVRQAFSQGLRLSSVFRAVPRTAQDRSPLIRPPSPLS